MMQITVLELVTAVLKNNDITTFILHEIPKTKWPNQAF